MRVTDYLELPLPCGTRIGLLLLIDHRADACAPAHCIGADDIARVLLREWHRERVLVGPGLPEL